MYQWLRLNFGYKPAPNIASNAINILAKVSQDEFPKAAKELQEQVYIDDISGSRPTTVEAKHVASIIDQVLGKGHFQIKAWHSNRLEVVQSSDVCSTDLLGHRWDKQGQGFGCETDEDFTKTICLTTPLPKCGTQLS